MSDLRLKADMVLQDCKHSLRAYNLQLQSEELRIKWLCVITLLRAVGHVLRNVDAKRGDVKLTKIIGDKFREMINHQKYYPIFYEFILKERNRFLKQYEHGITRILRPKPGTNLKGWSLTSDVSISMGTVIVPNERDEMVSYLSSGPYKGRYEKDVAQEAYDWWVKIIAEIKSDYGNSDK